MYRFRVDMWRRKSKIIEAENLEAAVYKSYEKFGDEWESVTALNKECYEEAT